MDKSSYKKALPTYILLILVPSLFGLFLYLLILNIDKNHEIEKIKSNLSENATDFMAKTAPIDYFKPFFQAFSKKIIPFIENRVTEKDSIKTKEDLSKGINEISKNLGENIRCALFNENAEIINQDDLKDYEIRFFTYLWIKSHDLGEADYKNRLLDQLAIMGRELNIDTMRTYSANEEIAATTFSLGKTGVFYIKNANQMKNGVLIFVEYKRSNIELVQAKIKDYATYEEPIIFYDIQKKQPQSSFLGHKEIPYERTLTDEFLDGFIEDKYVWKGFKSDSYKLLFGHPFNHAKIYERNLIIAIVVFLILLTAFSWVFFRNFTGRQGMFVSIRYKLISIFALAIYMPALSLWVLSYTSLHDHRKAIENKVKKGMLDVLNNIDNDFKKVENDILNSFLSLDNYLKSFSGKRHPTKSEIQTKLEEIVGKDKNIRERFNWLDIRTIDQTQIYTTSNRKESQQRLVKIGRVISILCLERYCPERLNAAGIKPNQSDILIGNLFENPIAGFSSAFERPKKLNYLTFDGAGVYWWWNYYPDLNNEIAFCMGTSASNKVNTSYFKSISNNRYTFENINLKMAYFNYISQELIPENLSNYKELLSLINVSNINKTVESTIVNYKNNKYLCLCMPGSKLKDTYSLCMYPVYEIDYQIEKVRMAIYTLMILLLVISVFTGLLLSKTFITPVKELDRGLEALRNRDTGTTINIENRDELGHLGNAFNQMMAEIKDMLLAGAVQQCLIPTGRYKMEGYDCIVYNQMATDVGGDYADIFELPDDRSLIVIGDVTGHGVASSLLTAMVKASVFRFANKNASLNEIVTNTSNMICDLLNKKKLMTFCAIILDKKTGEMAICNAGHPYPMIRAKEEGVMRTPCKTSLPMGLSKKRCRYNSEMEILNPDETLFLYTDGFPEAENDKGEEFGYDNFNNLIRNYKITSSEDLKNHLIDVLKNHHGEKELADDITFIILRRKPFQDS